MKHIVLKPRMSEKAYQQSLNNNVYVFEVPNNSNKLTIERAVSSQFDVTVVNVRTMVQKGKTLNSRHKRARPITVNRKDIKKAYVTLKEGDSIAVFDVEEDKKVTKKAKTVKKEAK